LLLVSVRQQGTPRALD